MRIDETLHIRDMLADLDAQLARLAGAGDLSASLLSELESADTWNAVLTTPCIFETYFGAIETLTPLSRRLRAIEQTVRSAFLRLEVDIVVQRPFSKIERTEEAVRAKDAPRDLSAISSVRERAAQEARAIADRSAIVLDCFAPGFNSTRIGSRQPRFTIFDPSS